MAAIDFPASPTTGQIFVAGNGVSYQYNGTLWLATGASAGGDFQATGGAIGTLNTSAATVVVLPTVLTGNSGGWYSTSTGRFTPPAGRYNLSGWIYTTATAGNTSIYLWLYKNGTLIPNYQIGINSPGSSNPVSTNIEVVVDANGSDYFELRAQGAPLTATIQNVSFGAFPISGIKGPPGDMPAAQSIMLTHSSSTIAAPSGGIQFSWNTVEYNTTGGIYSAPNFTVPTGGDGLWHIEISMCAGQAAAKSFFLDAVRNGVSIVSAGNYAAPFGSTVLISHHQRLVAGDTVRALFTTLDSTYTIYCGAAPALAYTWMCLTRVGA